MLEFALILLAGSFLAFRFRLLELFFVSCALLCFWTILGISDVSSIGQSALHFSFDLVALQGGAFVMLMAKNRATAS